MRRWRSVYGAVVCARCHPPADAALVAGWEGVAMETMIDTVSAAVPLTALPREDQLTALQEAQHETTSKKTTAKQTRAVVKRRQEATTGTPERDGHPKAAEATRAALPKRLAQLFDPLEALATVPDLEQLLLDMPPD
jgi:hypothetical protein